MRYITIGSFNKSNLVMLNVNTTVFTFITRLLSLHETTKAYINSASGKILLYYKLLFLFLIVYSY
jgi:hypothetical protein